MLVAGSLYLAYVFSYLYLWTVSPEVWPEGGSALPAAFVPVGAAVLLLLGAGAFVLANRMLPEPGKSGLPAAAVTMGAALLLAGGVGLDIYGHLSSGLDARQSSYAAMVYMADVLAGQVVVAVVLMAGYAAARLLVHRTDREWRNSFDHVALLGYYAVGQTLLGLLLVHGFPRLVG